MNIRSLHLALLLTLALLLAACSGGLSGEPDEAVEPEPESEAPGFDEEPIVEEGPTAQEGGPVSAQDEEDLGEFDCQLREFAEDVGQEEADKWLDEQAEQIIDGEYPYDDMGEPLTEMGYEGC